MSEEQMVRQCAPTLAGVKTGSIFPAKFDGTTQLFEELRRLNGELRHKGVTVVPLRHRPDWALIYVFRFSQLKQDLRNEQAKLLLEQRGYPVHDPIQCLRFLVRRMQLNGEFPHEVGLFLGYPPEDVAGFLKNPVCGYKCVGYWKVYGDERLAKRQFQQYRECTEKCYQQWRNGQTVAQLAVSIP